MPCCSRPRWAAGAALTRREPGPGGLLASTLAGATAGAGMALLVALAASPTCAGSSSRSMPMTLNRIGYGLPDGEAAGWLALGGAVAAALGSVCVLAPGWLRRIILGALGGVVVAGLLRELIRSLIGEYGGIGSWAISYDGLLPAGAAVAAVIGVIATVRPGPRAIPRAAEAGPARDPVRAAAAAALPARRDQRLHRPDDDAGLPLHADEPRAEHRAGAGRAAWTSASSPSSPWARTRSGC